MPTSGSALRITAGTVLALVLTVGCAANRNSGAPGGVEPTPTSSRTAAPSASGPPAPPYGLAPLTALPAASAAVRARPALATPLRVTSSAPLAGLDRADVVYEEPRGRLIALFQSQDSPRVGPIAGTQPEDGKLLPVAHPLFAYAGGAQKFIRLLDAAPGLTRLPAYLHRSAFTVDVSRPAPYNVYAATPALFALAPSGSTPPPNLVPFGAPGQPLASTGVSRAGQLVVTVPGLGTTVWTYDGARKRWLRPGGTVPSTGVTNVIVQFMPYKAILDHFPSGTWVSTPDIYGTGTCLVASAGVAVRCSWKRAGPTVLTNYVDSRSVPVRVAPGPTWLVLAPVGSTVQVK